MWYRLTARVCGFVACAAVVLLAAQWLSISFGWDPPIAIDTAEQRANDIDGALRDGPAIIAAVVVLLIGVLCFVAWLLSIRPPARDDTFRVGGRAGGLRIDRDSLGASLERRLEPLDRRVDTTVAVSRRGRIDLRLVTPDPTVTGPVAEQTAALTDILIERGLPCRLRNVSVFDVRRLKSRHRVR